MAGEYYRPIIGYAGIGTDVLYTRPEPDPVAPEEKAEPNEPLERDRIAIATAGYAHFCEGMPTDNLLALYIRFRDLPVVSFAYHTVIDPILAGTRSLIIRDAEGGDAPERKVMPGMPGVTVQDGPEDKLKRAAERIFEDQWADILTATECLNYGHWTQEVSWDRKENLIAPVRFNSFRPWEIVLIPDVYNDFAGFKLAGSSAEDNERDARYAFHCIWDEHRAPLIGYPRLRIALESCWRIVKSHENGDKIEKKASGIQMMIGVPKGQTYAGADGKTLTHEQVVQTIVNAATAGKTWTYNLFAFDLPTLKGNAELAKIPGMKVDAFDWGQTGPATLAGIDRRRELAVEIVRAYNRPEREAMEGQFGTKAEAGVHGQVGITDSELVHADILTQFNEQVFNRFLVTNRGPDAAGSMYWKADPLADPQRAMREQLLSALLASPVVGQAYEAHIDRRAFMQSSEIPLKPLEQVQEPPPLPAGPQDAGMNGEPGGNGQAGGRMRQMEGANGNGN